MWSVDLDRARIVAVLERYLDQLARLRDDLDDAPAERRAVAVLQDRLQRRGERRFSIHLFASEQPGRRERSRWVIPLDRDRDFEHEWYGVGVVHGRLEPGDAIVVTIGDLVLWPGGPLRPVLRGVRWRPDR